MDENHTQPDQNGLELKDIEAAKHEALKSFVELTNETPEAFWRSQEATMTVTDGSGLVLFVIYLSAVLAPAIQ